MDLWYPLKDKTRAGTETTNRAGRAINEKGDFQHMEPKILVESNGKPVKDVDLLVLFPNTTWKQVFSDETGQACPNLYTTKLPMTVFAACHGFAAHVEKDWVPAESVLTIKLQELPDGGSRIFPFGSGYLPDFEGRLCPILDSGKRTYLYADNVAINDADTQPVPFEFGEDLHLVDSNGRALTVQVVDIVNRASLLQFCPLTC